MRTPISNKIARYCNENGLRSSEKKIRIAEQLFDAPAFIDAESLWLKIDPVNSISRASVYRILNWLHTHHFVEKKLLGKRLAVYRLKDHPNGLTA